MEFTFFRQVDSVRNLAGYLVHYPPWHIVQLGRAIVERDDSNKEGNVQELRSLHRGLSKGIYLHLEENQ